MSSQTVPTEYNIYRNQPYMYIYVEREMNSYTDDKSINV